jgi:hypothetical protein
VCWYFVRWKKQRVTLRMLDAGKKINGRKRFIVIDTLGLLITVTVCAAGVQDRDGAKGALLGSYLSANRCRFVFADAGFVGRLIGWAQRVLRTVVHIVRKPAGQNRLSMPQSLKAVSYALWRSSTRSRPRSGATARTVFSRR